MQCPHCHATVGDSFLQCSACGAGVAFMVASPQGQQLGPYSLGSLRQYITAGQIDPNSFASVGGGPWTPLQQVLAAIGEPNLIPAPAVAPAPPMTQPMPAAPAPQPTPPHAAAPATAAERIAAHRARRQLKGVLFWAAAIGLLLLVAGGSMVGFWIVGKRPAATAGASSASGGSGARAVGRQGGCPLAQPPPASGPRMLSEEQVAHTAELIGETSGGGGVSSGLRAQMLQDPNIMVQPTTEAAALPSEGGKAFSPPMAEVRCGIARAYLEDTYGRPERTERVGDHTILYYDSGMVVFAVNRDDVVCLFLIHS